MVTWAHQRGVDLRLIEPGKPNQNAYIEAWHREYNEERPKKVLGGLTPAAYAKQLAENRLH